MLTVLFQTRDRFLFLPIRCTLAWCSKKSLGKYNFRSILGYFLPQWNQEHGRWWKKKAEHLISVYFTVEGKEGAAAAVIPESHFKLALCCQNHIFTRVSQMCVFFHLRPSKKSVDSNNHNLGNVSRYYSEFSWEAALFSTYRLQAHFQDHWKNQFRYKKYLPFTHGEW